MHRRHLLAWLASTGGAALVPGLAHAQRTIGFGEQRAAPPPSPRTPGAPLTTGSTADTAADPHHGRFRKPAHDIPLKNSQIVRGTRDISAAWLSGPVQRYRHYVLGADVEAETLTISMTDRRIFRLTLPKDAVFEDRIPRLVDLDGDGRDEVVIVKSNVSTGSVVAVAAVKNAADGLKIIAVSEAPGSAFRWVNPAGIADFTGRGRPQIAVVRQPHTLGELDLLVMRGGELNPLLTVTDVSNHATGTFHQTLHAVADFTGEGLAQLAIPTFDRRALRFLSFKGGRATEFHRVNLAARAQEDFRLVTVAGRPAVDVGLASGRRQVVGL